MKKPKHWEVVNCALCSLLFMWRSSDARCQPLLNECETVRRRNTEDVACTRRHETASSCLFPSRMSGPVITRADDSYFCLIPKLGFLWISPVQGGKSERFDGLTLVESRYLHCKVIIFFNSGWPASVVASSRFSGTLVPSEGFSGVRENLKMFSFLIRRFSYEPDDQDPNSHYHSHKGRILSQFNPICFFNIYLILSLCSKMLYSLRVSQNS